MIRLSYTSDFTPSRVYDYTLADGTLTLRKQTQVNNYDSSDYLATREWATAADGTKVPLTILRRAGHHQRIPQPGDRLRLRQLRGVHGPGLRHPPAVPA